MRLEEVERRIERRDDSTHSYYHDEEKHGYRPRRGRDHEEMGNHTPKRDKMLRKIKIPKFNEANDLGAYLAWEMKFDQIFNSYDYKEDDNVLMGALEFEGCGINW